MSGVNYTINGCTINTYKYKEIPIKTPIKSHPLLRLEKLQIIPNINNLMFQVIFIFSDWAFTKQIIDFFNHFCLGETEFLPGTLSREWVNRESVAWVKMHRFNAFPRYVNTKNLKIFTTHGGIYKLESIQQAFWREIKC